MQVLGQEHSGRVTGLGIGPTPTQVFKPQLSTRSVTNNVNGGDGGEVDGLKSELQLKEERIKALEKAYKSQGEQVKLMKAFAQFMYTDIFMVVNQYHHNLHHC